jgi:glycosyltransferase involved in cell wall biosynthesis
VTEQPLRILQVNTVDNRGGAAQVAWNLHRAYREREIQAWMTVGRKFSADPTVAWLLDDVPGSLYMRPLLKVINRLPVLHGRVHSAEQLGRVLRELARPRRWWDYFWGLEDFHHPGTRRLLELFPETPNIVHCHNLHGKYFDLRVLPWLSQQVPIVLTLHDAWLLSGHCAHSFACERWKIGCGHCPDLTITPAIRRDATAYNWRRKQEIYAKSQFYVATPAQWLMRKVEQSILASAVVEAQVIPNGVDLSVFHPLQRLPNNVRGCRLGCRAFAWAKGALHSLG